MVLPIVAAALPWIGTAVGAMLPTIIDMFRTGKSPEEAAQIVAPKRQEIVDRLIGTGMNQAAAEAMADESIKGELAQAQLPEQMNPWLTGALMIGGGIAGAKLGGMAKARMTSLKPTTGAPATPPTAPNSAPPAAPAAAPVSPTVPAMTAPAAIPSKSSGPFPLTGEEAAAAEAVKKQQYYDKLRTLDDGTQGLVDDMMPKASGPFPEFLPGEMQSRIPSAMLRPWESMPEVEGAMIRKQLGRLKADPRGLVNVLPPEGGPFPSPDAARMYSSLYRYEGG